MKKISVVSLLFAACTSPIFASNTFLFLDIRASNQNFEVYQGQEYDMSPYTGALGPNANGTGGTSVQLFCDDFSDDSNYGTGWQVNVTTVDSADLSKTRYGSANANPAFPSGTTLYEEIAWLFTQSAAPGQTLANQDAIQEAVWDMTYPTGTPKATATASSPNMTYLQWIGAAESDYNTTAAGYLTPDYSKWLILTDPIAAGNTGGQGMQEFLAYSGGVPTKTPEPGSLLLMGSSLILGSFVLRKFHRKGR